MPARSIVQGSLLKNVMFWEFVGSVASRIINLKQTLICHILRSLKGYFRAAEGVLLEHEVKV